MSAQPSNILPFKVPRKHIGVRRDEHDAERIRQAGLKAAIDRADRALSRLEARQAKYQAAADEAAERFNARRKVAERRAEKIENRVIELMQAAGLDRVVGNEATLTIRLNALSLVVDDVKLIPDQFMRTPKTPAKQPDKIALKKELERIEVENAEREGRGEPPIAALIEGCHLAQSVTLLRSVPK